MGNQAAIDQKIADSKLSQEQKNAVQESFSFWDKNKTFKPKKQLDKASEQAKKYDTIKATMQATLGAGDWKKMILLPKGSDENEWIAIQTLHFYDVATLIYGTLTEFCTAERCPKMSAGNHYEYRWKDGNQYKEATTVPAPTYITLSLNWIWDQLTNPDIFPVDGVAKFPKNFRSTVKTIYKKLFRLYAHLYHLHLDDIKKIGADAHLNTCFKHIYFFITEFKLVKVDEMKPMEAIIQKFVDEWNVADESKSDNQKTMTL